MSSMQATKSQLDCSPNLVEELKRVHKIEILEYLGRGSYSQVALAVDLEQKKKVAVKIIDLLSKDATAEYLSKFLPREVEVIKIVDHPNIMKTFQVIDSIKDKMIFVSEYCAKGDILQKLKIDGSYAEADAQITFRQLMEAMMYLQSKEIVHRDMKCENLFLDMGENLKVGDFGFARFLRSGEVSKTFCGSRVYVAPEVLLATPYTGYATDIWSCGIVLYVMLIAAMPFSDKDPEAMVEKMQTHKIPFPDEDEVSAKAKALMIDMMHPNPASRPSYKKICEYDWLKNTTYFLKNIVPDKNADKPMDKAAVAAVAEKFSKRVETAKTPPATTTTTTTMGAAAATVKQQKNDSLRIKIAHSIKSFRSRIKKKKKKPNEAPAQTQAVTVSTGPPTLCKTPSIEAPTVTERKFEGSMRNQRSKTVQQPKKEKDASTRLARSFRKWKKKN